jgi:hypothetical protein
MFSPFPITEHPPESVNIPENIPECVGFLYTIPPTQSALSIASNPIPSRSSPRLAADPNDVPILNPRALHSQAGSAWPMNTEDVPMDELSTSVTYPALDSVPSDKMHRIQLTLYSVTTCYQDAYE